MSLRSQLSSWSSTAALGAVALEECWMKEQGTDVLEKHLWVAVAPQL